MNRWALSIKRLVAVTLLATLSGCPLDGVDPSGVPQTRAEASRFLTQATFGPEEASIQRLMDMGYEAWINEQFAIQPAFTYRAFMSQRDAELKLAGSKAGPAQVLEAFYTRALTDKAQLRARLTFALSEIFVVSFVDEVLAVEAPGMVAGFMDTLDASLPLTYRDLLESVAKSPAMGQYLTFKGNTKEAPAVGHYPDENFAREVMQLFSIGLYELNNDGSLKLGSTGQPMEAYTSDDVKGLAKVFTGWGNYRGPAFAGLPEINCFAWMKDCRDPAGDYEAMTAYPAYHSTSAKTFLGVTVPAQDTPSPQTSLNAALDRLATHPNTAPFFCKQLIQRLVSSNPSPEYIDRVATRFTATGGNIKETVKAILMDDEARGPITLLAPEHGKLREPVLRLTAILRAFQFEAPSMTPSTPKTAYVTPGSTSDPATSFGQTPLYSPSVFNFFRPGYTTPQSQAGSRPLVAPEMQLVNETSVTGYVNAVQDLLVNGIGPNVTTAAGTQRNITLQLAEQRAMAYDPAMLTQHIADRLTGGSLTEGLRQTMTTALATVQVPALNSSQSNGDEINRALDKRVWSAVLMLAVSPEFLVTK